MQLLGKNPYPGSVDWDPIRHDPEQRRVPPFPVGLHPEVELVADIKIEVARTLVAGHRAIPRGRVVVVLVGAGSHVAAAGVKRCPLVHHRVEGVDVEGAAS